MRQCTNNCGRCEFWYDFAQYYEDPLEPDDYGHCLHPNEERDATSIDDTCQLFELHSALKEEN